ncbi:MAG: hypothetical protein AAFS10_20495 [Myxococcota bacterium]
MTPITCPNCHYTRSPEDSAAPADVCPRCQKPYAQWDMSAWSPKKATYQPPSAFVNRSPVLEAAQRQLTIAMGLLIIIGLIGWSQQGTGVMPSDIHPMVRKEPAQGPTDRKPFEFEYRGNTYEVKPVHSYSLSGLVVSHNDIDSMWDAYHTADSVDTKDLCVIWGGNTMVDTFGRVNFSSGSWTCYASWGPGVDMNMDELSNNHLITDRPEIRALIAKTRIGDQIHLEGMLVNYRQPGKTGWRNSSTTRTDTGNTACEVVFVEQMQILERGTPLWYALTTLARWLVLLGLVAKMALFVVQLRRDS